jgi:hypothetical protein
VDKVQLLEESKITEKGHFTIMGFVLFADPRIAEAVALMGRVEFEDFVLIINKVKSKGETHSLPSQSKPNKQKNLFPGKSMPHLTG